MDAARSNHDHTQSMGELALRRLAGLRAATGCALREDARETLRLLLGSACERAVDGEPSWSSDVTDDGSPFEFSLALESSGAHELRVLVERQEAPFDLHSNWAAGLELHERLRAREAIGSARFDAIADLFAPEDLASRRAEFAIWHAASLSVEGADSAAFKVYLNPQIRGPERARSSVCEALARLDLPEAWRFIEARLALPNVRLVYFALDLSDASEARVKVYLAHDASMVEELERALAGTQSYQPGDATEWVEALLDSHGPFDARPVITSYAFSRRSPAIARATLHLPVRCYHSNDDEALGRALGFARARGIPVEPGFSTGIEAWAGRPLQAGRGMLTYVSCRRSERAFRATFYLAPQLYAISSARTARKLPRARRESYIRELGRPQTMHVVQERIEQHTSELRRHSFLQRLLDGDQTLDSVQALARRLTFFVLAFQDMLRLTAKRMTHPLLAAMARTHQQEDKGHDVWFLSDLKGLCAEPELKELFSDQHEVSRDVAYELLSLLLRSRDDRARMAVLMVMETAGAEFFPRIVACMEKLGRADDLIFFGRHHMQAEAQHTAAEPVHRDQLWQLQLEPEVVPEVLAAVDDAFGAMTRLAGALASSL